jgi:beta-xylosidase
MPDKAIQVHWAAMLKDYQLGTYYCVQGINDNSSSDLQTFINYASAGNNQLGIAEKMVEKLVK